MKTLRTETLIFLIIIVLANLPLLFGDVNEPLIFFATNVADGEWWRVLTFPFAHVSWYHLLMDAVAFLFLYNELQERATSRRLLYFAGCGIGSLLFSLWINPLQNGLCGLSGIAHGLMAITGIELLSNKDSFLKKTGIITLILVLGKSIIEIITGSAFFSSLHLGNVGQPVVACHLGGVIGAILTYPIVRFQHFCKAGKPHTSIALQNH